MYIHRSRLLSPKWSDLNYRRVCATASTLLHPIVSVYPGGEGGDLERPVAVTDNASIFVRKLRNHGRS